MKGTFFLILGLLVASPVAAQTATLPPCGERPAVISEPWTNGLLWCLEQVISDASAGELGFTALAAAPDGTLYAARPLKGEVLAITDTNGDALPDTAEVAASGLTLPNGLLYHDGILYITGSNHLYSLRNGDLTILRDDIPAGPGFWTGSLALGPDDRLYFATGANCDQCDHLEPGRGTVFSVALDGTSLQPIAEGFRAPADLAFMDDGLWVVDSLPSEESSPPDELNRVTEGAWYGWPPCTLNCPEITAPAFIFPSGSRPLGVATYTSTTFPTLTGTLLVVLAGDYNAVELAGYRVVALRFQDGTPVTEDVLIPDTSQPEDQTPVYTVRELNYRRSGFWPRRPLDVAVTPQGWIYVSISDGRIVALRPLTP